MLPRLRVLLPLLATLLGLAAADESCPPQPCSALTAPPCQCETKMEAETIYALLDRILPGERAAFSFTFAAKPALGYTIAAKAGKVSISASGTNELAAGLGYYLRQYCECRKTNRKGCSMGCSCGVLLATGCDPPSMPPSPPRRAQATTSSAGRGAAAATSSSLRPAGQTRAPRRSEQCLGRTP